MERHPIRAFAGFLSFAAGLTACAPLTQYRTEYKLCVNSTPEFEKCALQQLPAADGASYPSYLLGFIEFDDQGQLWDREQMSFVLGQLEAEAAKKDLLMVVFVHGWKHNAAPTDHNIHTFQDVLAKLARDENYIHRHTDLPERQVAGIYLGWRGRSVTLPVAKELTFWARKNTAQKVGHGGATEVLNRIELIKHNKDSTVLGNTTRLAIIGHSFGAAVLNTALVQILENRVVVHSPTLDFPWAGKHETLRTDPLSEVTRYRCT